jgi:hypothetical protein
MKPNILIQSMRLFQGLARQLFRSRIFDNQFHALMAAQITNDFGIDPRNRLELARPIELVMRPRQPGGGMGLPLGGHAK